MIIIVNLYPKITEEVSYPLLVSLIFFKVKSDKILIGKGKSGQNRFY